MATSVSKDANAVLVGASDAARQYAIANAPGEQLTSGEAQRLLAQFNASPDAVMSANNITATNTNPTPAPDDLLGIRKQVNTELGVDALQKAYQEVYGRLSQFDTATDELNRKIKEQPLGMNVIRGEQATASDLRATERAGIAREAEVAQSALLAAQQEAKDVFSIRESEVNQKRQLILQYPGAGLTFADSFETAASKLDKYQEKVKKDEYKSSLKSKLIELGLKTSGNTKSLESRLRKANKKALSQVQEENKLKLEQLRLNIEDTKSQIANRGAASTSDVKSANENFIYNSLSGAAKGEDGFVDPSVWGPALAEWQDAGGTTSEFISKFGGKVDADGKRQSGFINPFDL